MIGAATRTFVPIAIGRNLRDARLRVQPTMTISRLAVRAGCSPALISRIESGVVTPSFGTLGTLAAVLGVSLRDLLDPEGPARRAESAIAAARTLMLVGRAPDLAEVIRLGDDALVPPEWRARAFALIATALPHGTASTAAAASADATLGLVGDSPIPNVTNRARIEVSHAVGEDAWARGDATSASRRWGNGLAIVASADDLEALWARASIARALARATPGTRTAANALMIAIEALVPMSDPVSVAARLVTASAGGTQIMGALALAIVGASQSALADARARLSPLTDTSSMSGASSRGDLPLGRHLR